MNGTHGLLTMVTTTFCILQVETSLKTTSKQPLLHTLLNVLFLADEEVFLTSTIKRRRAGKRKENCKALEKYLITRYSFSDSDAVKSRQRLLKWLQLIVLKRIVIISSLAIFLKS